jgi:antitoxin YefM
MSRARGGFGAHLGLGLKEGSVVTTVSYTEARSRLASLLDRASDDLETVYITRRGRGAVAMISADELSSLLETVHLLRSPANAERLQSALEREARGEGVVVSPETLTAMRAALAAGDAEGALRMTEALSDAAGAGAAR